MGGHDDNEGASVGEHAACFGECPRILIDMFKYVYRNNGIELITRTAGEVARVALTDRNGGVTDKTLAQIRRVLTVCIHERHAAAILYQVFGKGAETRTELKYAPAYVRRVWLGMSRIRRSVSSPTSTPRRKERSSQ